MRFFELLAFGGTLAAPMGLVPTKEGHRGEGEEAELAGSEDLCARQRTESAKNLYENCTRES